MGNVESLTGLNSQNPQLTPYLSQLSQSNTLLKLTTCNPQDLQQTIHNLSKIKKFNNQNVTKIIDLHSVESHNLCSTVSYVYVIIENVGVSLVEFVQKKVCLTIDEIVEIIVGVCRGAIYLGKDLKQLQKEYVAIIDQQNNGLTAKITPSYLIQQELPPIPTPYQQTLLTDLANLLNYLLQNSNNPSEFNKIISDMYNNTITLKQVLSQFQQYFEVISCSTVKKNPKKLKIKRLKDVTKSRLKESRGDSLLISGGREENYLKDFYQNTSFRESITNLNTESKPSLNKTFITNHDISISPLKFSEHEDLSHKFPQKSSLKSHRSNKSHREHTQNEKQNKIYDCLFRKDKSIGLYQQSITRDQSLKEYVKRENQRKTIHLCDARYVESQMEY